MLYSYDSSENQLFMVNVETYSQGCSHTHICENMQSDRSDCNQTLAKHKHCHSFGCALKPPHPAHPHTKALAQCTKIGHFISGSHANKKREKMIVRCSQSMRSDTHVPSNVKAKWISRLVVLIRGGAENGTAHASQVHNLRNCTALYKITVHCIMFLIETGHE